MSAITSFFAAFIVAVGSLFGSGAATGTSATASLATSSVAAPSVASSAPVAEVSVAKPVATSARSLPKGSSWLSVLPLGDHKYTTDAPKKGYIYLCHIQSGGQGAQVNGPWIHGDTWNPGEKVHVEGAVSWPEATYHMQISGATRTISSNDLPTDSTTGIFPIRATDPAAAYDRNPSSVAAQDYSFSLPAYPAPANEPGCMYGEVGIMDNGVLLLDGFDAEYRDALAHELQDENDGHPNEEGYHKHGFISDIKGLSVSKVVGFAFDGYPITGPMLSDGSYLRTADLDVCHGMTSEIYLDGKLQTSYHYVLTQDFPYSASCFHGALKVRPDTMRASSSQGASTLNASARASGSAASVGAPPAPPTEAISACTGKATGASCSVGARVSGSCAAVGSYFACIPQGN